MDLEDLKTFRLHLWFYNDRFQTCRARPTACPAQQREAAWNAGLGLCQMDHNMLWVCYVPIRNWEMALGVGLQIQARTVVIGRGPDMVARGVVSNLWYSNMAMENALFISIYR